MRRLLLILILLQIVLPAHSRAQNTADSTFAAAIANLVSMSAAMANDRCTKVAEVRYNDYSGYNTITVFRYTIPSGDSVYNFKKDIVNRISIKSGLYMVGLPKKIWEVNTEGMIRPTGLNDIVYKIVVETAIPQLALNTTLQTIPVAAIPPVNTSGMAVATGLGNIVYKIVVEDTIPQVAAITALHTIPAAAIPAIDNSGMAQSTAMIRMLIIISLPEAIDAVAADTVLNAIPIPAIPDINTGNLLHGIAATMATAKENATDALKNIDLKLPVEQLHLSYDGYSLLQKLEGYAPALYTLGDGGYTIGFGFFVPFNEGYKYSKGVTWEQAEKMMRQKMPAYEDQVKEYVNVPITQSEFDALTMLAYNIGGFAKATSIINDINEEADLAKLQSDWKRFIHSKAPNVSKGLINRRNDEMLVRKAADYQPERKIQIFKKK